MLVDIIAVNRPDILRVASVLDAIRNEQKKGSGIGYRFIYTGSDIDINLDRELFSHLKLDRPNVYLGIQETTNAAKTAAAMLRYEKLISAHKPDMLMVTGKCNEAVGCAYVAKKNGGIKVSVINAGIRVDSNLYLENINRILLDSMADYLFTSSHWANDNLRKTGVNDEQIFLTGNTHIDSVIKTKPEYEKPSSAQKLQLQEGKYLVVILNKAYNISDIENLKNLLYTFIKAANGTPIIVIADTELERTIESQAIQAHNLYVIKRVGYLQLGWLLQHSLAVITDSNNIQEQCTVLAKPTLTLSPYSESPETIDNGYNKLIGNDITLEIEKVLRSKWKNSGTPYLWDGKAAERIISVLKKL